jgi:transposase, IS5 family
MERRQIGQEQLAVSCNRDRQTSLDAILTLLDWTEIGRRFDGIHAASTGEAGWPPRFEMRAIRD